MGVGKTEGRATRKNIIILPCSLGRMREVWPVVCEAWSKLWEPSQHWFCARCDQCQSRDVILDTSLDHWEQCCCLKIPEHWNPEPTIESLSMLFFILYFPLHIVLVIPWFTPGPSLSCRSIWLPSPLLSSLSWSYSTMRIDLKRDPVWSKGKPNWRNLGSQSPQPLDICHCYPAIS